MVCHPKISQVSDPLPTGFGTTKLNLLLGTPLEYIGALPSLLNQLGPTGGNAINAYKFEASTIYSKGVALVHNGLAVGEPGPHWPKAKL